MYFEEGCYNFKQLNIEEIEDEPEMFRLLNTKQHTYSIQILSSL